MQKFKWVLVVLSIFLLNSTRVIANENPIEDKLEIDSRFNVPDVEMTPDTYVIDTNIGDVNGDDVRDSVILIGTRESGVSNSYVKNINIIVRDGKTLGYKKFMPGPVESGFEPKLFLGDFNGDKIADIYTSIASGGSGGTLTYSIISFKDNNNVSLFNQVEFSQGLKFDVIFKDKFKVEVSNKELGKKFNIDLASRKADYIELKVYDKKGKLLNPVSGFSNPLNSLQPIDEENDGVYEINSVQRLAGIANADTIGYAKGSWKYEDGKFVLKDLKVTSDN